MSLSRSRKLVYSTITAAGLLGGSAAIAAATTNGGGQTATATTTTDGRTGDNNPAYTSSVTAPDNENEQGLTSLATATADQARQAAIDATGGTASKAELENENGNVVYGVEVTLSDGRHLDVKVDAGNAKVLAQEADGNETESPSSEDRQGRTDGEQGTEGTGDATASATTG
ncbi:MAG: PepSY domain-containing protein [Acidimicrobiia bacterium]